MLVPKLNIFCFMRFYLTLLEFQTEFDLWHFWFYSFCAFNFIGQVNDCGLVIIKRMRSVKFVSCVWEKCKSQMHKILKMLHPSIFVTDTLFNLKTQVHCTQTPRLHPILNLTSTQKHNNIADTHKYKSSNKFYTENIFNINRRSNGQNVNKYWFKIKI